METPARTVECGVCRLPEMIKLTLCVQPPNVTVSIGEGQQRGAPTPWSLIHPILVFEISINYFVNDIHGLESTQVRWCSAHECPLPVTWMAYIVTVEGRFQTLCTPYTFHEIRPKIVSKARYDNKYKP